MWRRPSTRRATSESLSQRANRGHFPREPDPPEQSKKRRCQFPKQMAACKQQWNSAKATVCIARLGSLLVDTYIVHLSLHRDHRRPRQVVIERADEPLETRNRGAVSIARCRQTFKHGQPHPFSSVLVLSVLLCRGNRAPSTATLQPTPTPSKPPSNLNSAKGDTSMPYKHAKRLSSRTHFTPDNIPTRG